MTVQTLERAFKASSRAVETPEMRWLYTHLPPIRIRGERDHAAYRKVVAYLIENGLTGGERRAYLEAVIHFLDEYERQRFPARAEPEAVLCFLMDEHGLTQSDLANELGGQSVVSAVVNGKRKMTRQHIERLSRRFSISPAAFYPAERAA